MLDLNLLSINIDDIPQDRFSFIQGDRKIIITLTESSNSILGNNLVYKIHLQMIKMHGLIQTLIISVHIRF